MFKHIKYFLLVLVASFSFVANAQLYPVQVNTNFVPPHNVTLSSYTTTTTNKINLRLNLTDINENNLQIRLKMKITGRGLNIQSRDFIIGALPIFINGGQILDLTSYDLRPYFELQNLAGINPQQYNRPLPDGFYKICFEVYTANTPIPQLISNPNMGCTFVNLIVNDPPILNLPQRGEQVILKDPINIIFQWTPRHLNATNVSYDFEIREIWDNNIDPQAGFLASPPLYSETIRSTTFLYNNTKPALLPDKTYAWRVRAISTNGISENSVFRNNGYSEIFYIKTTQNCDAPIYAMSEALSTGRVKITWQGKPEHNKYHVQYKKTDVADAEWFEVFTYNEQAQISNLEAGVTYDFRVGGTCNSLTQFEQSYTYTNVNQFTMPTEDETVSYNCGVVPDIQITNQTPLQNLGVNETFTAGDFPVTVKGVEGGNGRFSGVGFIVVPYLADTKIAVEFEGISINTEYQLIDGVVKTTYDPTWSSVEDVDDLFGGGAGGSKDIAVDFPITLPDGIQIDPNGDILIVSPDGGVIEVAGGKDVIITDGSSPPKQFAIDEDGNIKELGEVAEGGKPTPENTNGVSADGEATDITAEGVTVTFRKAEDGTTKTKYGFDAYNSSYSSTKELYTKLGSNYYIPYKAVKNGDSDYLIANITITDNTIVADSLVFKTQDGTAIEVIEKNSNQWKLKVEGFLTDADKEVLATIKQGDKYNVAGAFKLYHLAEKTIDVIAVDATTADISNLETYLNNIYKQSVVKVNLIKTIDFTNELNNIPLEEAGKIQSGESGFLANYTDDQQKINKELKNRSDYDTNAYYLIFTDKLPSSAGEKGLMPVGRQFGYVYSGGSSTASHELGHGAFKLRHPFSNKSYGWNAGATNWLMDYSSGEHLPYVNWQEIHNPKIKLGIFDSDEEGEFSNYVITPDFRLVYITQSKTLTHDPNQISSIPVGTCSGFVVAKEYDSNLKIYNNIKRYYWNNETKNYQTKNGEHKINPQTATGLSDKTLVSLFYNYGNCPAGILNLEYKNIENRYKTANGLLNIIEQYQSTSEALDCVSFKVGQDASTGSGWDNSVPIDCNSENIEALLTSAIQEIENLVNEENDEIVAQTINNIASTSRCVIRNVEYNILLQLIQKLADGDLKEEKEKAVIALMAGIKNEKYTTFFTDLEANSNNLIIKLENGIDNHSIFFWDEDNNTTFHNIILQMYAANMEYAVQKINNNAEYFLDKYLTHPQVKFNSINDLISGTALKYWQSFVYNDQAGNIYFEENGCNIQAIAGTSEWAYYTCVTPPQILTQTTISPLSPVMIDINEEIPVVQIALESVGFKKDGIAIIPAIYLQGGLNAISTNSIRKSSLLALNGVTIVTGAPVVLNGATTAARLFALAEVAGAVSSIVIEGQNISPNSLAYQTVQYFNLGVGIIGVKNLLVTGVKGTKNLLTNLSVNIKPIIQRNESIRNVLLSHYTNWRIARTNLGNLDNLTATERNLIVKQENVWRTLGYADELVDVTDDFIQSSSSIQQKMSRTFDEIDAISDTGKRFELKTGKKLDQDGIEITDLGNEIKGDVVRPLNNNQPIAGDRDIGSISHLIECKTTLSNRSANKIIEQLGKMIGDLSTPKGHLKPFVNPLSKKIILYTEEVLNGVNSNSLNQVRNYINSNSDKIKLIDNYDDLLKELQ